MISRHLIQPRSTRLGMVLTTVGWDLPQLSIKTIKTWPIWWRQFFSWCPQVALDCLKLTMNLKSTSGHWLLVVLHAGVQGQSSGRFYIWEGHGHLLHCVLTFVPWKGTDIVGGPTQQKEWKETDSPLKSLYKTWVPCDAGAFMTQPPPENPIFITMNLRIKHQHELWR